MHVVRKQLKPLSGVTLTADETRILQWLRSTKWEPQTDAREPIPYKTKLPEFFGGVRLYRVQGGGPAAGSLGLVELFIKKLEYQGVLTKQELYPVSVQGNVGFLSLKKEDLDNLGVGQEEEEE
jgi:hypothetical protein